MKRLFAVMLMAMALTAAAQEQKPATTTEQKRAEPAATEAKPPQFPPIASMQEPAPPPARPEDVKSIDALIKAVYEVVSGPTGQKRDWDRLRSMMAPGARMIPVGPKKEGGQVARVMSIGEFAPRSQAFADNQGFYEKEIHRQVDQFGNIAQVFSTYEIHKEKGDKPFMRGINSFQLYNDGERWWVVTIFWEQETEKNPIPEKYLPKK